VKAKHPVGVSEVMPPSKGVLRLLNWGPEVRVRLTLALKIY